MGMNVMVLVTDLIIVMKINSENPNARYEDLYTLLSG